MWLWLSWTSQETPVVKNLPANAGDTRDTGSILGLERSPGEGNDNPLHYFCLENPMNRGGVWRPTAHGVANSRPWLSAHAHTHNVSQIAAWFFSTARFRIQLLGAAKSAAMIHLLCRSKHWLLLSSALLRIYAKIKQREKYFYSHFYRISGGNEG